MCGLAAVSGAWLIAPARCQGLGARDHLARGALDHQRRLPARRRRAEQGARDLGRGRRHRRRGRRAPRRRADRVPRLGVDLLRQRPGRDRDLALTAPTRLGEPRRGRRPRTSTPPARSLATAGLVVARLRDVARARSGLGVAADDRADRSPRRSCSRSSSLIEARDRVAAAAARALPGPAASAVANLVGFCIGGAIFGDASSCSASTCSRCSATRRSRPASAFLATAGTTIPAAGAAQALITRVGVEAGDGDRARADGVRVPLVHAAPGRRHVLARPLRRRSC